MNEEKPFIQKAQQGDRQAFGKLYDNHLPRIYRFVLLKVGRKQDAEDITHQVFMSAWERIGQYEFQGFPFSSWLYRIASNAVIDHYRTARHHEDISTVPEEVLGTIDDTSNALDTAATFASVRTALTKLDHDYQSVLIMKFIDERSNKEIAAALGKSEGAVRVIQHRALKQLKQHIENHGPHNETTHTA